MDLLYQAGELSAGDVQARLADAPSYSAVRTFLRILESKGHVSHRTAGGKYIYQPTRPRHQAARSAVQRLVQTFFDNSAAKAVVALMSRSDLRISDEEAKQIENLIERARQRGSK